MPCQLHEDRYGAAWRTLSTVPYLACQIRFVVGARAVPIAKHDDSASHVQCCLDRTCSSATSCERAKVTKPAVKDLATWDLHLSQYASVLANLPHIALPRWWRIVGCGNMEGLLTETRLQA